MRKFKKLWIAFLTITLTSCSTFKDYYRNYDKALENVDESAFRLLGHFFSGLHLNLHYHLTQLQEKVIIYYIPWGIVCSLFIIFYVILISLFLKRKSLDDGEKTGGYSIESLIKRSNKNIAIVNGIIGTALLGLAWLFFYNLAFMSLFFVTIIFMLPIFLNLHLVTKQMQNPNQHPLMKKLKELGFNEFTIGKLNAEFVKAVRIGTAILTINFILKLNNFSTDIVKLSDISSLSVKDGPVPYGRNRLLDSQIFTLFVTCRSYTLSFNFTVKATALYLASILKVKIPEVRVLDNGVEIEPEAAKRITEETTQKRPIPREKLEMLKKCFPTAFAIDVGINIKTACVELR
jgi:hypothetical protein